MMKTATMMEGVFYPRAFSTQGHFLPENQEFSHNSSLLQKPLSPGVSNIFSVAWVNAFTLNSMSAIYEQIPVHYDVCSAPGPRNMRTCLVWGPKWHFTRILWRIKWYWLEVALNFCREKRPGNSYLLSTRELVFCSWSQLSHELSCPSLLALPLMSLLFRTIIEGQTNRTATTAREVSARRKSWQPYWEQAWAVSAIILELLEP